MLILTSLPKPSIDPVAFFLSNIAPALIKDFSVFQPTPTMSLKNLSQPIATLTTTKMISLNETKHKKEEKGLKEVKPPNAL